jgi:hypothetical protein
MNIPISIILGWFGLGKKQERKSVCTGCIPKPHIIYKNDEQRKLRPPELIIVRNNEDEN